MSDALNVNIDAESVIEQNEKESYVAPKRKTEFNPKNYLNARLSDGETSKKIKIRLLPFSKDGGSPFHKVFIHTVKVNKENGQGWRTFVCPKHNHKGDKCPFCELTEQSRKLRLNATNEMEKKKYGDIEFMNRAKEAWIVRCIERNHEEDGVKFWMFNSSRKKDGVYDKIINLFNERWQEGKEEGEVYNIFDLNCGKDLIITLTKDSNNKTVTQITDVSKESPLSRDYDTAKKWIDDPKEWDEVYTVKPYDYMEIIVQGGIPVFDKTRKMYVDRHEQIERKEQLKEEAMNENFTEQKMDFTNFGGAETVGEGTQEKNKMFVEEADLPF